MALACFVELFVDLSALWREGWIISLVFKESTSVCELNICNDECIAFCIGKKATSSEILLTSDRTDTLSLKYVNT